MKRTSEFDSSAGSEASASDNDASTIGVPSYQRVASAIRQAIIDGSLEDGRRITTGELAQKYGVSLAPIREALLQLSAEGIVDIHPRRGTIVRAVTKDFLADVYEVRLGLIPYLEGERAAKASPDDIARMIAAEDEFEKSAAQNVASDMIQRNVEFHLTMINVTINRQAQYILARHRHLLAAIRVKYGFSPGHSDRAIEEHRQLIQLYRTASVDGARKISRLHLRHSFEELLEIME